MLMTLGNPGRYHVNTSLAFNREAFTSKFTSFPLHNLILAAMEDNQLKAGHPPAMKVGGMRVSQHRHSESEKSKDSMEPTEGNAVLKVSTSPPKSVATNISGAVARGNADFPAEAVQNFHEKPMPTHDVRNTVNKPNIIHQPRK